MLPPGIQDEFRPAVNRALRLCTERYGDRLQAVFLVGSVAFGEAWPGASDVDVFVFLDAEPAAGEQSWSASTSAGLTRELPIGSELHLTVHCVSRLRADATWRYLLKYFGVQLHGPDILATLEREGLGVPPPSQALGRSVIDGMTRILDETMEKGFPERIFKMPREPWMATRKLARWFMIQEGAYILMAEGTFSTFRQADVLQGLGVTFPQWEDLFVLTGRILADPLRAGVSPDAFISAAAPFLRWAIRRVGSA